LLCTAARAGKDEESADMAHAASKSQHQSDLASLALDKLEEKLGVSPKTGLSKAEAESRLTQYGANEIAEKAANPFLKFLSYF